MKKLLLILVSFVSYCTSSIQASSEALTELTQQAMDQIQNLLQCTEKFNIETTAVDNTAIIQEELNERLKLYNEQNKLGLHITLKELHQIKEKAHSKEDAKTLKRSHENDDEDNHNHRTKTSTVIKFITHKKTISTTLTLLFTVTIYKLLPKEKKDLHIIEKIIYCASTAKDLTNCFVGT